MGKTFLYVRFAMAAILVTFTVTSFVSDAIFQANFDGIDGPLAWSSSYTKALNNIALAIMLSAALVANFKFKASLRNVRVLRIASFFLILFTVIGFFYLLSEHLFLVRSGQLSRMGSHLATLYIFQIAFIMAAVLVWSKTSNSPANSG